MIIRLMIIYFVKMYLLKKHIVVIIIKIKMYVTTYTLRF